jgi:hypothetical protein
MVNDNLLKSLGGDTCQAYILSKFFSLYTYFKDRDMLNEGYFYQTIETIHDNYGISDDRQRSAISHLEERGLVCSTKGGSPPKRMFKLNFDAINALIGATPVRPLAKVMANKTEFYLKLNEALQSSWMDTFRAKGGINTSLAFFMYEFTVRASTITTPFVWTPKDYGELRTYWRSKYQYKAFDYNNLYSYFRANIGSSIYGFILHDRKSVERSESKQIHYGNVFIRGEAFNG